MAGVVEPSGKTTDDDEVDAVLVERTAHAAIRTSSTSSSATVAHQSVTLCFEPSPVSLIEGSLPLGQDLVVPVLLGELHP